MLFNSFSFLLLFLPIVAGVYAILEQYFPPPWRQAWLLAASLLFYGWAKPSYLPLLVGSILFNWWIGRAIASGNDEQSRKRLLRIGIAGNIGLLCCVKYTHFILGQAMSLWGAHMNLPVWEFPLGVSFFTLTQVMYLVDTYQTQNPPNSLFDHASFVSLFSCVTSGPLVHARSLVPQFRKNQTSDQRWDLACRGLYLFAIGLAKKVVLADSFAKVADTGFNGAGHFSTIEAWAFTFAYGFQLYFDFSGYSDMAVGTAWLLGIDIPQNFDAPFKAKSISEFWQRWHISLSNFITSYMYTPLLRSMGRATLRTSMIATLIAMTIAGIWHGPAWTFVIFGLLHGIGLAINQAWKKHKPKMPDRLAWLITFLFVNFTFVFFRSPNLGIAFSFIRAMLPHANPLGVEALRGVIPLTPTLLVRPVFIGVALVFFAKSSMQLSRQFQRTPVTALASAALVLIGLLYMNSSPAKQFVYFVF
jgi:D-alanyl-lipoteichoic acid acyltransferase DltB (MBOAT superfamily)